MDLWCVVCVWLCILGVCLVYDWCTLGVLFAYYGVCLVGVLCIIGVLLVVCHGVCVVCVWCIVSALLCDIVYACRIIGVLWCMLDVLVAYCWCIMGV